MAFEEVIKVKCDGCEAYLKWGVDDESTTYPAALFQCHSEALRRAKGAGWFVTSLQTLCAECSPGGDEYGATTQDGGPRPDQGPGNGAPP